MQKLLLQIIYSFLLRWFLKVIVGVKFDDASFLKDTEQFIIVANHNSHLDTMSLMSAMPRKILHKVKPVAAGDHFGKTKLKGKLTNYFVNALLIKRGRDRENPDNDPINQMIKELDKGYSLILFPEGTRGEPEKEQPLKKGIGIILSQRSNIKYVPVYMKGMGKALPKNDGLIIPFSSTLKFGEPTKVDSTDVLEIVKQVENSIMELKAKIANSV